MTPKEIEDEAQRRVLDKMTAALPAFNPADLFPMIQMMMDLFASLCGGTNQSSQQIAARAGKLSPFQKAAMVSQLTKRYRDYGMDRKSAAAAARVGITAAEQVVQEAKPEEREAFVKHTLLVAETFDIF